MNRSTNIYYNNTNTDSEWRFCNLGDYRDIDRERKIYQKTKLSYDMD
ncbi:hypothetical protein PPL_11415 [Heterostelium album PN500]|uniref:Uncharacterized protein n=1 Tax=Heterostelium pallidum (strain ATCC 26659 / Pp 5 / PN500) TaxID=670386 RepID=D3BTC2_HETP5|nr:hypothetical protein PPL_11415 [Heterostelium album PN500]EFA75339.1 hypothetical protein PPL_11415 [Heterostelium album PN500]|eukprot:XP_020427473.1 hypothetical protein PPL_11415 [Heterostelium album PN500]